MSPSGLAGCAGSDLPTPGLCKQRFIPYQEFPSLFRPARSPPCKPGVTSALAQPQHAVPEGSQTAGWPGWCPGLPSLAMALRTEPSTRRASPTKTRAPSKEPEGSVPSWEGALLSGLRGHTLPCPFCRMELGEKAGNSQRGKPPALPVWVDLLHQHVAVPGPGLWIRDAHPWGPPTSALVSSTHLPSPIALSNSRPENRL